jgi:hypothetical protein
MAYVCLSGQEILDILSGKDKTAYFFTTDLVWVKEAHVILTNRGIEGGPFDTEPPEHISAKTRTRKLSGGVWETVVYKADFPPYETPHGVWKSGALMPKWASRLTFVRDNERLDWNLVKKNIMEIKSEH